MCSSTACVSEAVATLTYVYSDSTAVLGPLASAAEPHSYDLCQAHAQRMTAPRGWQVVRVWSPQGVGTVQSELGQSSKISVDPAQARTPEPSAQRTGGRYSGGFDEAAEHLAEMERRKVEISKPLTQPDDDWAAIADVVRTEEALTSLADSLISPEEIARPRHAAGEHLKDTEIARRGHLRVLRGEG